jgi:hypothetical protein
LAGEHAAGAAGDEDDLRWGHAQQRWIILPTSARG